MMLLFMYVDNLYVDNILSCVCVFMIQDSWEIPGSLGNLVSEYCSLLLYSHVLYIEMVGQKTWTYKQVPMFMYSIFLAQLDI